MAYLAPLLYGGVIYYGVVWLAGLGELNRETVALVAAELGLEGQATAVLLFIYLAFTATIQLELRPLALKQELSRPTELPPAEEQLTEREVDVLKLAAKGMSNQEIAEGLVVSEPTVRTHVSNILGKLHLANRTQAALYALREGYARLE